ncbi:MAG: hypothetical protein P8Y83_00590 [Gammaproteobacteria bacterium]
MPPLRVIPAVIVMLLLVACEGPSFMDSNHVRPELSREQREKFEQYLVQAQADARRAKAVEMRNYVRYEMPDGNEHIYITNPGHPAHPAVVRRTIITRLGVRKLATRGAHGGSQQAFEKWLAEFKALDVNRPRSADLKPIPIL